MPLIVLDAGHGGANPGAVYQGRQDKDDVLALTLAIGRILEDRGVDVYYTRTTDIYESPAQKAEEGNQVGADYFVSIHRNFSPYPNQYSGVETLVYSRYGAAAQMANNINQQLEAVGFLNLGVNERTNLVVLNRTQMPAVLVEVGFINTYADNQLFDERFDDIAQAIANGILITLGM
ncbi:MAG: N-acetylmuramoyl-L-alanine amidase [Acetatifactor sp.]|nr:N-acetylmuramoyl-L-alanine amidase [Acetatifactor sp.]